MGSETDAGPLDGAGVTNEELAYVGGFFDGEGGATLAQNSTAPCAKVYVTNSNRSILEWISYEFGGHFSETGNSGFKKNKPCYILTFNGKEAAAFLEAVQPYLRRRKQKMALALALLKAIPRPGGSRSLATETERSRNILLRVRLAELFMEAGE